MTQSIRHSNIPYYQHTQQHLYILLTSLNLGGAEKIVSDQLWANYYSKFPRKITLIVIYDKEKEHSIPPNVNVVRLNNDIKNGSYIFNQIAYEKEVLVCHLINDDMAYYLFKKNLNIHIVIHNDKRGWNNSLAVLNHEQVVSLVAVCNFVAAQLKEVTQKNIYSFRHNINHHNNRFKPHLRQFYRNQLKIDDDTIVIGMTGRICIQKNYFLALDIIYALIQKNPQQKYKLIILGGIEKMFTNLYVQLLNKINILNLHDHVLLAGFKTDATAWLNCFDIALNTSFFEGLSMATQEFMMNGLPVVLSNVSGQSEIFDHLKQLSFFNLDEQLCQPNLQKFHLKLDSEQLTLEQNDLFNMYQKLVANVVNIIEKIEIKRFDFNEESKSLLINLYYGSCNNWQLLHSIKQPFNRQFVKPAFLTSNLNLGGAQRSLINILSAFKDNNVNIPLILLNQSNQTQFYNTLLDKNIDHFLCHESSDVFDICSNFFNYIFSQQINRIILWNVDVKIKLLLSKFLGHLVDIVDVSPGDYCFVEMDNESLFQESIYYSKKDFYNNLYRFVSKYDNTHFANEGNEYLKNDTIVIPNGVVVKEDNFYIPKPYKPFKFLICGRIAPSKHLDIILESFEKFSHIYPDTTIDIVGSVEIFYEHYYEQISSRFESLTNNNKINWLGHHENPQSIMKHYHSIVVLGTHQGSPNVVLEAAACKLPVIANDSGGTKDIINGDTGILLPAIPEVNALFQAMVNMYENYDTYTSKAQICFEKTEKEFSIQKMYDSYYKVIIL